MNFVQCLSVDTGEQRLKHSFKGLDSSRRIKSLRKRTAVLGLVKSGLFSLTYFKPRIAPCKFQTLFLLTHRHVFFQQIRKKLLIYVTPVKSCHVAIISKKLSWKVRFLSLFLEYHRNEKRVRVYMDWADAVSKLETLVWIWNHVSRSITWLLSN